MIILAIRGDDQVVGHVVGDSLVAITEEFEGCSGALQRGALLLGLQLPLLDPGAHLLFG